MLVIILAVDLQPALVVKDRLFFSLFYVIVPKYQPPSQHMMMRSRLPAQYENDKQELKGKLAAAKYCALTTDLLTSVATQVFMTATCHYILCNWVIQSAIFSTLLPCFAHTLNLIVQDCLSCDPQLAEIQKKCCNTVSYFNLCIKAI